MIAERLKQARRDAGLSQEELAARSGLHRVSVTNFERGREFPSRPTVERLSEALGLGAEGLLPPVPPEDGMDPRNLRDLDELLTLIRMRSDAYHLLKNQMQLLPESWLRDEREHQMREAHARLLDALTVLLQRPDIHVSASQHEEKDLKETLEMALVS